MLTTADQFYRLGDKGTSHYCFQLVSTLSTLTTQVTGNEVTAMSGQFKLILFAKMFGSDGNDSNYLKDLKLKKQIKVK